MSMTPVFDAGAELLGWFDGTNLFDLQLDWVGFHRAGHLFSSRDAQWLGPLNAGALLDRSGRVVAWLAGSAPAGMLSPAMPMRPMRPLPPRRPLFPPRPLRPSAPLNPVGGWSALTWLVWLGRALPPAPPVELKPVPPPSVPDAAPADAAAPAAAPDEGSPGA